MTLISTKYQPYISASFQKNKVAESTLNPASSNPNVTQQQETVRVPSDIAMATLGIYQQNLSQKIYRQVEELANETFGKYYIQESEIERLYQAIIENADLKTIEQRIKTAFNPENEIWVVDILSSKENGNNSFILDNIEDFKKIFNRKNSRALGPDKFSLIKMITEKEDLDRLLPFSDNPQKLKTEAIKIVDDSKEHDIAYGDEMVFVDSNLLINLLTCYQYNGELDFNKTVDSITEKSYRNDGKLHYYEIAEGILRQKPELIDVAIAYDKYIKSISYLDNETILQKRNEFFEILDKTGYLPKQIELKTIVPDKNALIIPSDTLRIMNDIIER